MALDDHYLHYPHRQYGMDHDRYSWSMLSDRPPVQWPDNKQLAIWINVNVQFFPLDQRGVPLKPPGGMTMPYPDLRHYTLRDYGNRVGIFRCLKALDRYGLKPTFALNSMVAERYPYLLKTLLDRGDEIICHGEHMDAPHYGGQDPDQEAEQIKRALDSLHKTLRKDSHSPIRGWLSPGKSESENTPELLAAEGIEYFCDWVNDDMPYTFNTANGNLWAMPLSTELDDRFILMNNLHSEQSYVEQICDACDLLLEEAKTQGGRILAITVHPWLLGQPHRIAKLEQVLEYISSQQGIWPASAGEILDVVKNFERHRAGTEL